MRAPVPPRPLPHRAALALGLSFLGLVTQAGGAQAVIGGTAASPGAYPFAVSLRDNGYPYCGGTIVSPQ